MGSVDCIDKMCHIMDGNGNYYCINSSGQLVVAQSRETAGVFSCVDADKKIGGGRRDNFYAAVPIEDNDDIKGIDWSGLLKYFLYIVTNINRYQNELNAALSDIDMQLCDIMHYIELYDMDDDDSIRMVALLKECRQRRRDIKDEMLRLESFQKAVITGSSISGIKEGIKQIDRLSDRVYHPRKLQKLFEDCPEKTVRENLLWRAFDGSTCMDAEKDENECEAEFESGPDEDANYNAFQKYSVYKKLKQLRNRRKELHGGLEADIKT